MFRPSFLHGDTSPANLYEGEAQVLRVGSGDLSDLRRKRLEYEAVKVAGICVTV